MASPLHVPQVSPAPQIRGTRLGKRWLSALIHCGLALSVVLLGLPLAFALIKSTQSPTQILVIPPKIGFGTQAWVNYKEALFDFHLWRYMVNSFVMASVIIIGKVLISLLAALALVYYRFPFKNLVFFLILVTLMLPIPVRIVPLYDLIVQFHWADTLAGITLPFLASATAIFIFRQHFLSIPASLVEAARIDGAGPLRFLFAILVPLSTNMISALVVIEFVYVWNQYLWPLVAITTNDKQVIQVGVKYLLQANDNGIPPWGMIMSGAILSLLPPLAVLIALQKQFLTSFGFGAEK